jgi:hypothetical protein
MDHVRDKKMVIPMLQYEEQLTKSEYGQNLYRNFLNNPLISLTVEKILNRLTLSHFGYDTSDESVENYRTIFKTYYKSPTDYDKEVTDSVHYMRENKVVYYTSNKIVPNDIAPNCNLYKLNGETVTTLYDEINRQSRYTVVAGFSLS